MQQYERDTWYDQNGRIVFTASKGSGLVFREQRPRSKQRNWMGRHC